MCQTDSLGTVAMKHRYRRTRIDGKHRTTIKQRQYSYNRTPPTINTMRIPKLLLLQFLSASTSYLVHSAVWTNGPEDSFFCGFKWDDKDCQKRQHCPSGDSEECEGNEDGIKCFANTNCDTRFGDGDWFVSGKPPKQSPGGSNRPTYTGKSENITDHYFCGVSLDDARNQCDFEYWCPSGASADCPQGNICFLGVFACDGRNLYPPTPYPSTEQPTGGPSIAGPTKIPTEMPIGNDLTGKILIYVLLCEVMYSCNMNMDI